MLQAIGVFYGTILIARSDSRPQVIDHGSAGFLDSEMSGCLGVHTCAWSLGNVVQCSRQVGYLLRRYRIR
jgi:hypothetical protein